MMEYRSPLILLSAGSAVEDRNTEILCNLRTLYATQAGELALDRDYGIDGGCLGYPLEHAKAMLTAELVRKTARYEPRARVSRVEWAAGDDGMLIPKVVIELV